jgi:GT2 family glycosyltransferase
VCAIIVTWNRRDFVTTVLKALARQSFPVANLDVVVVDNAGTDGTLEHLCRLFNPERVVDNDTDRAEQPRFLAPRVRDWAPPGPQADLAPNVLGVDSLTIVRNRTNTGGCGGFNTGFAFIEHWFGSPGTGKGGGPDFVWLVDDDVDLPTTVLEHLVATAATSPDIGLVGSRTCDLNQRDRTIETTIYYNPQTGAMQDDPPEGHRSAAAHRAMVERFGGPRGIAPYTGVMDVDVVSACSMLARWAAVVGPGGSARPGVSPRPPVGFWDKRYFIYCDDADWCLRFAKHGWKVVLSLDAVVFHTPWNLKLTPARIYYAGRNRLWMAQKVLPTPTLRAVTEQAMRRFLADSLYAALHRRSFHSRIILQTALDVASNTGGKTGSDGPSARPIVEALQEAGALGADRRVAVLCCTGQAPAWAEQIRAEVERAAPGRCPAFTLVCRNDIGPPPPGSIVYGRSLRSRLKKQLWMLRLRPHAAIVFDLVNDFPVLFNAPRTLHVDSKKLASAQVETDGWIVRLKFLWSWLLARPGLLRYARAVEPFKPESRYG